MKILFILLISLVLCVGCSTIKTVIEQPDGSCYTITSKKDSIVTIQTTNGDNLSVNNQGQQSAFEWFMVNLMANTDIQVGEEE